VRLFSAIELAEDAKLAVAAEQRRLRAALGDPAAIRWTGLAQMHLTLLFFGEVPDELVERLVEAFSRDVPRSAFTVRFRGLGVFPPAGPPRVLWLGVKDGGAEATDLYGELRARLGVIPLRVEHRPFHPHLTLGRWGSSRRADARRALAADSGREITCVRVGTVSLFRSQPSSRAPEYTALARATLT
jgi:2'-5' RNA ligase